MKVIALQVDGQKYELRQTIGGMALTAGDKTFVFAEDDDGQWDWIDRKSREGGKGETIKKSVEQALRSCGKLTTGSTKGLTNMKGIWPYAIGGAVVLAVAGSVYWWNRRTAPAKQQQQKTAGIPPLTIGSVNFTARPAAPTGASVRYGLGSGPRPDWVAGHQPQTKNMEKISAGVQMGA